MKFFILWLKICIIFAATWNKTEENNTFQRELREIKRKWNECCKKNLCLNNSCYTVQNKASSWAVIRQRCQSQYPDWPYAVDIFHIKNEDDIEVFWNKLPKKANYNKKGLATTVWTSGVRCAKSGTDRGEYTSRWISTNAPFPKWLEDKITPRSFNHWTRKGGCQFLAVSPAANHTDALYSFQDQNARHAAICEFLLPENVQFTTTEKEIEEQTTSTESTTKSSTVTEIETVWTFSDTSTTAVMKSKSLKPADRKHVTLSSPSTTESTTKSTTITTTTTIKPKRFCKGRVAAGIVWPDTAPNAISNVSCPKGLTGFAQWKCDGKSLKFVPDTPHIQECKHIWIRNLEKDVEVGNDAVVISSKLADETRNKSMSHGDITALVDLSAKILQLYTRQKGEEEYEISFPDQKPPLSYVFTKSMVASISNILRSETKDAWEILPKVHQTREATKILKIVTSIGSRLSCIRKSPEKLQFTVSAENIDMQTFIFDKNGKQGRMERMIFPQQTEKIKPNSTISLPSDLHLYKWSSPCRKYSSAVGVMYKQVGDFLKDEKNYESSTHVATKVISFSLGNNTEPISLPDGHEVIVALRHIQTEESKILQNPRCVFWNFSKKAYGEWDTSGCHLVSSNETHTLCKCNHLTNFAVLMDINNNVQGDEILSLMTYVCCGVSSLTLVLTLICFFTIRSLHGRRTIITGNLCFSLLITNLLILFGLDQTHKQILCSVIAGFLHFWVLSAFCWMLVEGYHLYKMVILVFQRGPILSVKYYYLFAYGTPVIIVGISAAVRTKDYVGPNYCWLSSSKGLMWSFVGPACVIILVNIVIFVLTLRSASSVKIKREQSTMKKIKSWIRGSVSVMCLLGLTWCLGLFYIEKSLHVFSYIFTVLNGLQGVFIFLFHVLLNDKVYNFWTCKERSRNKKRKFGNQTSTNPLRSRTSNRTSINSIGCTSSNNQTTYSKTRILSSRTNIIAPNDIACLNGVPENAASFKPCAIMYRKKKATQTISENGMPNMPFVYKSKLRSQSLPEDHVYSASPIRNSGISRAISSVKSQNYFVKQ